MAETLKTEVLVVGAGAAGIPAAIGAARVGAKVILIEEDSVIGGAVSDFYVDMFCGGPMRGVALEAQERLQNLYPMNQKARFFLPAHFQLVYGKLLEREKNITVITGARAVEVLTKDGKKRPRVTGVRVERGGGNFSTIESGITIDATGSGIISILAGCRSMYGTESTGTFGEAHAPAKSSLKVQQCTWMYISQRIKDGNPFDMMKLEHVRLGVLVNGVGWFHNDPEKAMKLDPGIFLHWGCAVECQDTRDPVEMARAQGEALKAMERDLSLLSENGYAVYLAPRIGVREAGRIVGEHVITENDLRSGKLPEDTIAVGGYGLDIWGGNIKTSEAKVPLYGLPYRAIVPMDVDGLLLAGKIISGSHLAMSAYRVMPIVGSAGQAAGVGAAISIRQRRKPRDLDPKDLQKILKTPKQGEILLGSEVLG